MNNYRITLEYYSGWYRYIYIKAQNEAEAFSKTHSFITMYDGVREIIPKKISKKYMVEHNLQYDNEEELREQAYNRNCAGMKKEQMEKALDKIMEISKVTRPGGNFHMWYTRMTEEELGVFTDWDVKRFGLRAKDEYVFVADSTGHILYAINVSGDSVMQSIAELTDLLAGKGW